jgi:dihydroflavonol-4-reductase
MKYLVSGDTGFLGRHLRAALEGDGHQVVGFSRSTGGDVLDPRAVRAAAEGCDGAFHCAGQVSRRPEDAEALYRVHVEGTKSFVDGCRDARVARVVFVSTSGTCAVRETGDRAGTEDDPPPIGIIGRWPYYRAKLFAERAALEQNGKGIEVVACNPSLLLGPGDERGSSTDDVRLVMEGAVLAVPAGGLSFADVRDVAGVLAVAMQRGRPGERYLVGSCNLTVRELFARIARIAGVDAPWLAMPRSRQVARVGAAFVERFSRRVGLAPAASPVTVDMAQCFWYVDSNKAENELGWSPRDPNATLHDTVSDLRARGVVWPSARFVGQGPGPDQPDADRSIDQTAKA